MAGIRQRRRCRTDVVKAVSPRVSRGEVWLAALDPTVGSEIEKTRPCVIISPSELHDHLRTVLAAPMTTGSRPAPWRVAVSFGGRNGLILLDQIRALDRQRLLKRIGALPGDVVSETLDRLREVFAE
jgi:mRNA interferase MazF